MHVLRMCLAVLPRFTFAISLPSANVARRPTTCRKLRKLTSFRLRLSPDISRSRASRSILRTRSKWLRYFRTMLMPHILRTRATPGLSAEGVDPKNYRVSGDVSRSSIIRVTRSSATSLSTSWEHSTTGRTGRRATEFSCGGRSMAEKPGRRTTLPWRSNRASPEFRLKTSLIWSRTTRKASMREISISDGRAGG